MAHLLHSARLLPPLLTMAVLTAIKITHGGGEREKKNKLRSTRAHLRLFVIVCAFAHIACRRLFLIPLRVCVCGAVEHC